MKFFQRRADQRKTSPSWDTGQGRQAWLQIKAKGKTRYVWRTGVMGWGLPVFAIFTPTMLIFGPRTHRLAMWEIVVSTILSLLGWTFGGYVFGLWMWKTLDNKYR